MKRIVSGILFTFILCGFICTKLFAKGNYIIQSITPQIVRVGISDNYFSNYLFDRVSITSANDFVITDNYTGEIEFKGYETANIQFYNGSFSVYKDSKSVLKTQNDLKIISINSTPLQIVGLKRKGKPALYSGSIELTTSRATIIYFNASSFNVRSVLTLT